MGSQIKSQNVAFLVTLCHQEQIPGGPKYPAFNYLKILSFFKTKEEIKEVMSLPTATCSRASHVSGSQTTTLLVSGEPYSARPLAWYLWSEYQPFPNKRCVAFTWGRRAEKGLQEVGQKAQLHECTCLQMHAFFLARTMCWSPKWPECREQGE